MRERDTPVEVYGERIPWEIPVQLCIKDFLREGECAFDVGANIGGVTVALSRLAGSTGRVHAFEANPMLLPRLEEHLAANRAANVIVVPKAVWATSGRELTLYCDQSHYASASSLVRRLPDATPVFVDTISLDDYCRMRGVIPRVIKVDVEGAEFQVLTGAREIIDRHAPIIVFEYYADATVADDAAEFARACGYALYDVNLYRQVDRAFYLSRFPSPPAVNILAIPHAIAENSLYASVGLKRVAAFEISGKGVRSHPLKLSAPGRYIVKMEVEGPNEGLAALKISSDRQGILGYVEGRFPWLKDHSRANLVFEVSGPMWIRCELEPREPGRFEITGAEVFFVDTEGNTR